MAKEYRVWLIVEEYDDETDRYTELDAPGSALVTFDTYDAALDCVADLTSQFDLPTNLSDGIR